jgi:hypothetical protein
MLELGASTVKWTTLDPYSSLSESDPKLYTNFELHEIEIKKTYESTKPSGLCSLRTISNDVYVYYKMVQVVNKWVTLKR